MISAAQARASQEDSRGAVRLSDTKATMINVRYATITTVHTTS